MDTQVPAESMLAGVVVRPAGAGRGDTGRVDLVRRPLPTPGAGEVLVQVAAAGINRVDIFQRDGFYTPPPGVTDIPGVELAGTVVAVGADVEGHKPGDRVCGIVIGGGYAEYCCVPATQLLPIPAGFDFIQAAGITETFSTVWTALVEHGRFKAGETLLIHGGSSGIGTTAIMLARILGAKSILVTAGSAEKCSACVELGADRAINYREETFEEVVARETEGRGVDVVLDMVAGDYVPRNIECLAEDGRLVFVGRMSQQLDVTVNVNRIMYRRLIVTGVSLRGQPIAVKTRIANALRETVWPHLESGRFRPLIDRVYPLDELAQAHDRLVSSQHIGKIILSMPHDGKNGQERNVQ